MKVCNSCEFCLGDQYCIEFAVRSGTEVLRAIQGGNLPDAQAPLCLFTVSTRRNGALLSQLWGRQPKLPTVGSINMFGEFKDLLLLYGKDVSLAPLLCLL